MITNTDTIITFILYHIIPYHTSRSTNKNFNAAKFDGAGPPPIRVFGFAWALASTSNFLFQYYQLGDYSCQSTSSSSQRYLL
jgi:hypothetical protein